MKKPKILPLLFFLLFLTSIVPINASASSETNEIDLWIVLHFRDYKTDLPVSNLSVTATISLPFQPWQIRIGPLRTNETGTIQTFLEKLELQEYSRSELAGMSTTKLREIANNIGIPDWGNKYQLIERILKAQEVSGWKELLKPSRLQDLKLSDNYTLIKVENTYVEDIKYNAEYIANTTIYEGLQISLAYNHFDNNCLIEGEVWLLKGKIVKVSDCNPVTGERESLFLKPAVKTEIMNEESSYESYYLVPVNYEVTVFHDVETWEEYLSRNNGLNERIVSPLTVEVDENTTLINWMSHAGAGMVKLMRLPIRKGT